MKRIKLNKGAELLLEKSKGKVSYFFVLFKGGYNAEKILQLSHLTEHVIMCFDVENNGKIENNGYMGKLKSDARTEDDFMRFQFFVLDEVQLQERVDRVSLMINNVHIPEDKLEKEKQMIITEWATAGKDVNKLLEPMQKISPEDVKDYIKHNVTANNLQIYAVSSIEETTLVKIFNNFIKTLNKSKNNNPFTREKEMWQVLHNRMPDLSQAKTVELTKEIVKTPSKILYKNRSDKKLLFINFYVNCSCNDYLTHAKMSALTSFIANFNCGIKKVIRHEKGLVYRTNTNFVPAVCQSKIETEIFVDSSKLKQTIKESLKWFENLAKNGLTEQEYEVLKFDYKFNAYTRPALEDLSNNYRFNRLDYLQDIESMGLEEFNKFVKQTLNKKCRQIIIDAYRIKKATD